MEDMEKKFEYKNQNNMSFFVEVVDIKKMNLSISAPIHETFSLLLHLLFK